MVSLDDWLHFADILGGYLGPTSTAFPLRSPTNSELFKVSQFRLEKLLRSASAAAQPSLELFYHARSFRIIQSVST